MGFAFNIEKCVAWAAGLSSEQDWIQYGLNGSFESSAELTLPPLKNIPAMQRRRLSPFAKLALHCAMEAAQEHSSHVDTVFSSRHGDLHRTATLIRNVADQEGLSPTQFGLSVHNAAAGLFSIYCGNKAPISAISAGESSFIAGLIDSLAKLKANGLKRILYVYTDLIVPDIYLPYVSAQEQSIAIALLLTPEKEGQTRYQLEMADNEPKEACFQPMDFMKFIYEPSLKVWGAELNHQQWALSRTNP